MKKCSICKKKVDYLTPCWVLKEGLHGHNANPDYWMVERFVTKSLCDECVITPIMLEHTKHLCIPFVLNESDKDRIIKLYGWGWFDKYMEKKYG